MNEPPQGDPVSGPLPCMPWMIAQPSMSNTESLPTDQLLHAVPASAAPQCVVQGPPTTCENSQETCFGCMSDHLAVLKDGASRGQPSSPLERWSDSMMGSAGNTPCAAQQYVTQSKPKRLAGALLLKRKNRKLV